MATIDDDDRHEYIAHGDNGRDDAKIGNRDNDIDYPSDDDLYYLLLYGDYSRPAAWKLLHFPYPEPQVNLQAKLFRLCHYSYRNPGKLLLPS